MIRMWSLAPHLDREDGALARACSDRCKGVSTIPAGWVPEPQQALIADDEARSVRKSRGLSGAAEALYVVSRWTIGGGGEHREREKGE